MFSWSRSRENTGRASLRTPPLLSNHWRSRTEKGNAIWGKIHAASVCHASDAWPRAGAVPAGIAEPYRRHRGRVENWRAYVRVRWQCPALSLRGSIRLPKNAACGFPARRSSEVDSQNRASLKVRVGKPQLRAWQRVPLLDSLECLPRDVGGSAPATQHLAPSVLRETVHLLQCTVVAGNAVVGVVAS